MNYYQEQNQQTELNHQSQKSKNRFNTTNLLLGAIVVIQLLILGVFGYTQLGFSKPKSLQIVDKVSQKVAINQSQVLGVQSLENVQELRDENAIQEEIYKNAQNGDYAVILQDKLIIFRESNGEIVYEGPLPTTKFNEIQQQYLTQAIEAAKKNNLITQSNDKTPQVSFVQDPKAVAEQNPEFYSNLARGDMIVIYSEEKVIFIYRPDSGSIIRSGKINTSIENQ